MIAVEFKKFLEKWVHTRYQNASYWTESLKSSLKSTAEIICTDSYEVCALSGNNCLTDCTVESFQVLVKAETCGAEYIQ